ncbi:protein bicaudal C homolog 1-A-like [Impatiens glandulifera]|uniref:protein bicaudal C homolog 1-A-like n=1 Tax=Impatiens glandulifera TaxID=253017 RepID=UPI001FB16C61|nr:protein bicaudal C homolog 1-A-like [Impatiens glandulifera]
MAEIQPPEGQTNGGIAPAIISTENISTKRQRRPSVRLGDIGEQTYDNRRVKQWKPPIKDSGKGMRTRPVVNLAAGGGGGGASMDFANETLEGDDREGVAIGSWKVRDGKSKRKRFRSNWNSKGDDAGDEKFSVGDEDMDERFRDFNVEGSDSRLKDHSPINSIENVGIDVERRRRVGVRTRGLENKEHHEGGGIELEGGGGPSDTDARNWNHEERNSVRVWLNQLGLGRYAPVFEIHEVDDEVLPMLTLEDLKDMGINAVGTRRKMFCAIQKLNRGFS